jgi:cell division protein FtsZ
MSFKMLDSDVDGAVIKVVGIGGGGGNAVNHMVNRGVQGVEFIAINTDRQALSRSLAAKTIQLGDQGLGAGANPEAGRAAAQAARGDIRAALEGANMVFITAGMGKGTGTGASPVVAEIAKELGILTVGVVTKPFNYEGTRKLRVADEGIDNLIAQVDSLIVVLNEKLFEVMDEDATLEDAFKRADDVLNNAVAGIAEIINVPGLVNVDFADVKTIMGEQGKAMMGIGEASGLDRARLAAEQAVSSPLLEGVDLHGARGVIVNITATRSLKLREVIRKPQLVPQASVKTGTDNASAEQVEYTAGLDEPAVFRNPRSEASARISAMTQKGVERLDIPAFLRRQAD